MMERKAYVYIVAGMLREHEREMFKIGSTQDFCERGRNFNWHGLVHVIQCPNRDAAYRLERELHQQYASCWVKGRDWFDLTEADIDAICVNHPVDEDEFDRIAEKYELIEVDTTEGQTQ